MKSLEERFWSKVDIPLDADGKPDTDKCWMWIGSVDQDQKRSFNDRKK